MKAITVKISKETFKETNTARIEHHKDASVIFWHHVMIRKHLGHIVTTGQICGKR